MKSNRRASWKEWFVTSPSLFWLSFFFVIPTLLVFAIAFKPANPYGGIGKGWSLQTLFHLANPNYPSILWRTLWISLLTTVICLVLAVPTGYHIARLKPRVRQLVLLLVIVPFWTSFLVRIFAWKILLHPEGFVKRALVMVGLAGPESILMYNSAAVLLVMVYTYLPFSILPIYAAAEKYDFRLTEAARDLGAGTVRAFFSVFLPAIRRGILTSVLVVFIPALGSYVIPDIVGGPGSEMMGNKIAQRVFVDRNLPHAAALSALLILAVMAPLVMVLLLQRNRVKNDPFISEDS